jgi:hypothetical protein
MAKSARQTVFEGMELLPKGLQPFVMQRLEVALGKGWPQDVISRFPEWRPEQNGKFSLDTQKLLKIMERLLERRVPRRAGPDAPLDRQ